MLNKPIQEVEHLSAEVFSKMKILRLLIIGHKKLRKDFINGTMKLPKDFINGNVQLPKVLIRGNVQLPKDLSYLSNELCIIEWHRYPFKSMPTSFQPKKLVELRMHCSRIIQLWKGIMVRFSLKKICIFFLFINTRLYLIIFCFITDFRCIKTYRSKWLSILD